MQLYSLIANSGIQMFTFPLKVEANNTAGMFFHEWYDPEDALLKLEIAHRLQYQDEIIFVRKKELFTKGYLAETAANNLNWEEIREDGILPLKRNDTMGTNVRGDIFKMSFGDKNNKLDLLQNIWLPLPYFQKRTERRFSFGPLNWCRFKLIPGEETNDGYKHYNVLLAFDTRTGSSDEDEYKETPCFADNFEQELKFALCKNEFFLMDYCSLGHHWSYVNDYIRKQIYPESKSTADIKGTFKYSYIASYLYLINHISQNELFPEIMLYKDKDVPAIDIDLIVDVGNSRTTAILVEDNKNFNQIRPLELQDYTDPLIPDRENGGYKKNIYNEPFDMRIAFRKVNFGKIGIQDSRQFIYPSFVRLGIEANKLIHNTVTIDSGKESLSTHSSPKRYLWDNKPNKEDWEFITLPGEDQHDSILNLPGITNQLNEDGSINFDGLGGLSFRYSRKTLMTFSFLEMLVQAKTQINSYEYRVHRGAEKTPRRIKRIIITCPTTMSNVERTALAKSAKDAAILLENFEYKDITTNKKPGEYIDIIPTQAPNFDFDDKKKWYYDEATCAQLVYIYAEISKRYGGHCDEFFRLYGKKRDGDEKESLIIGSLDIGAGTSDLMISKYSYSSNGVVRISPKPIFFDSFYYAGDDMLKMLILNLIIEGKNCALRKRLSNLKPDEYKNITNQFFGPNYNGQSFEQRILRRDFNIQVSIPLIYYFLDLINKGEKKRIVKYEEVFSDQTIPPSPMVLKYFEEHFGFDFRTLEWDFNIDEISTLIERAFDDSLLKMVATIMYGHSCDIVILSGRPTSLPPLEKIFLKYYPVTPNRLILLNKYHIGNWYPFNKSGYISNPKTIVSVGAMIGHYASELANLDGFSLTMDELGEGLKPTSNYIINPNQARGARNSHFITPTISQGTISVSQLPMILRSKQVNTPSYPERPLFKIDYNRYNMTKSIVANAEMEDTELSPADIENKIKDTILRNNRNMPLEFVLERDSSEYEKENVRLESVTNGNQDMLSASNFEISIQSIGDTDSYWLDSGIIIGKN